MQRIEIDDLPEAALAAANKFYSSNLANIREQAEGAHALMLVFGRADDAHTDWRKAAIAGLAREHAPVRINAISGGDAAAQNEAADYLSQAAGVTGQYLPLHDDG